MINYNDSKRTFAGTLITVKAEDETLNVYRHRRNINNKALRAYLRGDAQFRAGYFTTKLGKREPQWYSTPVQYIEYSSKIKD